MIAQNIGLKPVIFDESSCAGENVMAVSAWPKVRLEIGEKTEVYILMRLKEGKVGEEIRPALL
jgi:conjugal transfer pilus assembly protein TraK